MAFVRVIKNALFILLLTILFPSGVFALPQELKEVKPPDPPRTRQVIVLVIDGLQAESLSAAATPNIYGLGMAGTMAEKVSTMPPDNTESRIYSVLYGRYISRGSESGEKDVAAQGSLLSLMEKKGIKTALIDGTGRLIKFGNGVTNKYYGTFNTNREVIDRAVEVIKSKKPFLSVVVLAQYGKGSETPGTGPKNYTELAASADSDIGSLLRQLHIGGIYEDSLLVVTGTTGSPPLIIKGRDFHAGVKLPPVSLKDVAPTLGYIFGVAMPDSQGLVLWNSFRPGPDRSEGFMLQRRVRDLSAAYSEMIDEASKMENEKTMVQEEKARLTREKQFVEDEITQRDRRINELNLIITVMKFAGLLGLGLFIAAMVIEYRILKKRYLFFT
ncbi:MAG: hypothetical protein ACOY46_01130 [Bacillota bacterium]